MRDGIFLFSVNRSATDWSSILTSIFLLRLASLISSFPTSFTEVDHSAFLRSSSRTLRTSANFSNMDSLDPFAFMKAIVPKVPMLGKTALYHMLGLSETAKQRDLRTELTVSIIRSFFVFPSPQTVSEAQRVTLKDPGVKGKIWISKVTVPVPEEDYMRQSLFEAIEAMKEPGEAPGGYKEPELKSVEAEWTGYREGATKKSPELPISEAQKYDELMKEVTSPATILFLHGGAYYLLDPVFYRSLNSALAKLTKARCLSVRYRLAPENPFPSALLDALVCYFNLLYPSPGSLHKPVEPQHIVISGDSAGGNLALALLQTLLQFRRMNIKIKWNGEEREVPLPAGMALISPWTDITQSSPSYETNAKFDYLLSKNRHSLAGSFPPCPIWPANPPRKIFYAEDAMLSHPLVSPILADWTGSPPMWIVVGEELLVDEGKYVAMVAARQGVTVLFDEFEAMPHIFAVVIPGNEASKKCFTIWSSFIKAAVENPDSLKTRGSRLKAKTLQQQNLDVEKLISFTDSEVREMMRKQAEMIVAH